MDCVPDGRRGAKSRRRDRAPDDGLPALCSVIGAKQRLGRPNARRARASSQLSKFGPVSVMLAPTSQPAATVVTCVTVIRASRPSHGSRDDHAGSDHSMTRSARKSVDGSIATPIAMAVFRLITRSNFIARSIGISPALTPRRIRSTK